MDTDLKLPDKFTYHVRNEENGKTFRIKEIKDPESFQAWMEEFSSLNFITWRVLKTYPNTKNRDYMFRKDFRCQHFTDRRAVGSRSTKNTDCPAKLIVKIDRFIENLNAESSDPKVTDFPACISIVHKHNHSIISAESLKYRDMSEETKKKLCELFRRGHNPSSALHCLKTDLIVEHGDDYYKVAADGSYLPSVSKTCKLYEKEFKENYGGDKSDIGNIEDYFKEFNSSGGIGLFQKTSDGKNYFAILITPIMLRTHESIQQTSELVLLDACGGIDKQRHRLYAFVTPTAAGGLPLGLIITDSETEKVFYEALTCFKNLLLGRGFYKKDYPLVMMTDNDLKERNAIKKVFPKTTLLLCQFHMLKAMWSWLCNKNHNIHCNHRQELYFLFKNIVYSYMEDKALKNVSIFMQKAKEFQYSTLIQHFQWLWEYRQDWVCCYRKNLVIRGNNTTNYVEVVFRILKDIIFDRILAYNLIQMIDYLATRYEIYLQQRLIDFANGRYNKSLLAKMQPIDYHSENFTIVPDESTSVFIVTKETKQFLVDLQRGICSCSIGKSGKLCIHASATLLEIENSSTSFNVLNDKTRELMLYVATGKSSSYNEWFKITQNEDSAKTATDTMSFIRPSETEVENMGFTEVAVKTMPYNASHEKEVEEIGTTDSLSETIPKELVQNIAVSAEELDKFSKFVDRIKNGLKTDPTSFAPALKKMLSNIEKNASTDSGLISAMHTFGLYTGVQSSRSNNKRAKKLIQRSHKTVIGVQPTAISRRKYLLSGRRKLNVGRPVSSGFSKPELRCHDYTTFGVLPKRKRKATHNLTECVYDNKGLGSSKK